MKGYVVPRAKAKHRARILLGKKAKIFPQVKEFLFPYFKIIILQQF
jgi:hypothetical protein